MWSKPQIATFQRGLATARKWADAVERLRALAKLTPAFAQRVEDLANAREHLELLCATALQADPYGEE